MRHVDYKNRIEFIQHKDNFVTARWKGSKYRPAVINVRWLDNEDYESLFYTNFNVSVIEVIDFSREAIVVRNDVLFGILPFIYKTKLALLYRIRKSKAHFMLWMQSHGWAQTREGCYISWKDIGKKPFDEEKQQAKDTLKMWKELP